MCCCRVVLKQSGLLMCYFHSLFKQGGVVMCFLPVVTSEQGAVKHFFVCVRIGWGGMLLPVVPKMAGLGMIPWYVMGWGGYVLLTCCMK